MARAAGKDLHGDCLSCATCGNSLRNVGHHFIEDKFYCDIHGTQRKAGGGRAGMDPNIFVKSSPTAAQPVHHAESPRAAYHPQVNTARPVSVSPAPSTGSKQVTTHYHTPKTQGILSPGQRGVPNAAFGADLSRTTTYGGGVGPGGTQYDATNRLSPAPSQFSQSSRSQQAVPPPVPSNPPPSHESRVPDSVRSAVSPRRSGKAPRQWPPPPPPAPNRYWQIDAADTLKREKPNYGEDLAAMIRECELHKEKEPPVVRKEPKKSVRSARRASNISKEQVQQAFEEHRRRKEEEELKVEVAVAPPEIKNGIHWTVIHSPSVSPAKVSSEAVHESNDIVRPIASYASKPISKTAIPKPFKIGDSDPMPIPAPRSPQQVQSYIVRSEDATVTRQYTSEEPVNNTLLPIPCNTTDSSTSPIPSIRLFRKTEPVKSLSIPSVSITSVATSPIKIHEPSDPSPPIRKDPKHFKKVDFSKTSPTVIPEWKDSADIVDESDILTEASKDDDSTFLLKAAPYDGDESEMIDNKSDVTSTYDIEEEVEEEIQMEERERERLAGNGNENGNEKIRVIGKGGEAEKQWRQRAMELLEDDAQTERDLMIVAALNERLQGLREMEDDDRIRAIECIARHQSELENTQTQLSTLLESAIVYLQNLRSSENIEATPEPTMAELPASKMRRRRDLTQENQKDKENYEDQRPLSLTRPVPIPVPVPVPMTSMPATSTVTTQSLHDVLDEFYSLRKPTPTYTASVPKPPPLQDCSDQAEDSRNFLASRLEHLMSIDESRRANGGQQGSSNTKTSFERTTTETRHHDNGAPRAAGDFRGTGHLTNTTTTQQNGGRTPFCEACKQQIRGAFVLATGKSWCPEHFVCANSSCRRRLLECGFVEEDGQKFCESCFEQHIAPRCAKCSKPIISDCLNALQKKWHPTCFTCAHCQKPFGNSAFYLEQGLPYCEQDWNALFTTKCVSCRYPIEAGDRWVEALGNAFHSNCFTCTRCNNNLEGESFFAKNGQPFCKLHA
uniref:LIM zinc-binding domain-containing protein n=1 Tax=Caenorhabditis japonica TaxID=281687 RepID=A0A8R1E0H6_CAEJA